MLFGVLFRSLSKEKSAYVTNCVGTLIDVRDHVSYILKLRTAKWFLPTQEKKL